MAYQPSWLTLAEAVKWLDDAEEAAPEQALRQACGDRNVRARGLIQGVSTELGSQWWVAGVSIDWERCTITKGSTSKSVPGRQITASHPELGLGDYTSVPVEKNVAEVVELSASDIGRIWPLPGNGSSVIGEINATQAQIDKLWSGRYEFVRELDRMLFVSDDTVENAPDYDCWELADSLTAIQAAFLWGGIDPAVNYMCRNSL